MSDRVASALRNSKKQEEKLIFKKIYSPPYTLSFVRAVRLLFSTEKSKLSSEELEYRLRFERLLFKMKYVPTPVSNVPDILESMDKEINNEGMCSA